MKCHVIKIDRGSNTERIYITKKEDGIHFQLDSCETILTIKHVKELMETLKAVIRE